jgi:hypothetical protein
MPSAAYISNKIRGSADALHVYISVYSMQKIIDTLQKN